MSTNKPLPVIRQSNALPGTAGLCYRRYRAWVVTAHRPGPGARLCGPERKTKRGAINAWNRLLEQLADGK